MAEATLTLGQRIVEAARLAAAMHRCSQVVSIPNARQQFVIGGADLVFTDEPTLPGNRRDRSNRSRLEADTGGRE